MQEQLKTIVIYDQKQKVMDSLTERHMFPEIRIIGVFRCENAAANYIRGHQADVVVFDVEEPKDILPLADRIREIKPDILELILSTPDKNWGEVLNSGVDLFLTKPFQADVLKRHIHNVLLLSEQLHKQETESSVRLPEITIRMFRTFSVMADGRKIELRGKAKEILAYLVWKQGAPASREEIESIVWWGTEFNTPRSHNTYFNALKRLEDALKRAGIEKLFVRNHDGCYIEPGYVSKCDYYEWKDGTRKLAVEECWDFLSEFSWRNNIMGEFLNF